MCDIFLNNNLAQTVSEDFDTILDMLNSNTEAKLIVLHKYDWNSKNENNLIAIAVDSIAMIEQLC